MKLFAIRKPEEPFRAIINFEHDHTGNDYPEYGHYWAIIVNLLFIRIYFGFSYYNHYTWTAYPPVRLKWMYGSYSPVFKIKLFNKRTNE